MKKGLLGISALLMALVMLFISIGWDVKFHYCTIDHELTGSLGDAAASCEHCAGHHHDHQNPSYSSPSDVAQFNEKCCCDDFDQLICFSDNYVFSSEKNIEICFQPSILVHLNLQELIPKLQQSFQLFSARKIPSFTSCRKMLIFFSSLKLNPLVF